MATGGHLGAAGDWSYGHTLGAGWGLGGDGFQVPLHHPGGSAGALPGLTRASLGRAGRISPVPMLLMAGLSTVFSCVLVLFFHTPYRRLQAEARASPSIQDQCPAADRAPLLADRP